MLVFTIEKKLEIYPFFWQFTCHELSTANHLAILRDFLVAPLISTVNVSRNSVIYLTRE